MNFKIEIMALKITELNGIFLIEGSINSTTAINFKNHFEAILDIDKRLTIDIDNVTEIDTTGMETLRELYSKAIHHNRPFYIVGTGCKEIYDDFLHTYAA